MAVSFPKNKINVLLLEGVHDDAVEAFKNEGYNVNYSPDSLSEEDLCEKIKDVHILGIRSKTKITQKVVDSADKLLAVGAFCIGTKQIDLDACKKRGIAVFNAPYSNTRSVVELAIGQIILLMRSTFVRSTELHNGIWKKTASGAREVRGKVLGIIGYGNIGKQLSVLAEAMGMKVIFYDQLEKLALGNAEKRNSMKAVFNEADVVSLHVDDNPDNKNLIGREEFSQMKDGVVFINLARGFVVDIPALVEAQNSGKVAGVAVDVYPVEPKSNDEPFLYELSGQPNTILTPHIGGSTMEAQKHIGNFVPANIISYINTGSCFDAVNLPRIKLAPQKEGHRFLLIHENISGVVAQVNSILAKYEMNITGQFLKTDESVGYLISDVIKRTQFNNLDIITSNVDLSGLEVETADDSNRAFILKSKLTAYLNNSRGSYDYVLIDCPPSLSLLTVMALVSSNSLLVPLQTEFFALEGLTQLMKTIERIKVNLNPGLQIRGILLTMYDKRNKLSSQVEKEARDYFTEKVYSTVIPRNVRLSEAPSHGMPVLIYDKSCPGSKSYFSFTDEFINQESTVGTAA